MLLHIRGAVGHNGIAHGVGFVEGVAGKIQDLVIDAVCHRLGDPVCHRAGNSALRITVDEGDALGIDDGVLFLAHGTSDHIGLTEGEAGQLTENLDDLFLVDDAAVGDFKNRTEQRVLIGDMFGVLGAFDEARDAVHGTRTVKGDNGGDVLNALRTQLDTDAGHAGAFHLENTHGLSGGKHLENRGVVLRHVLYPEAGFLLADQAGGVLQNGEVSQTEKVHLQQAQFLQGGHLVLAHHGLVVLCQGNVVFYGTLGNHDTGGVGRGMPGHAFQRPGHVDEGTELLVGVVEFFQGPGELQRLIQGHVEGGGDLFGDGVGLGVADVQDTAHIADRRAGGHGAEGDDLGDVVLAVEAVDVVDDLAAAVDTEVDVDIRHGDALRIQETLKEQRILDRVDIGDVETVGDHAAGGAAAAGTDGDAVALGIADEVRDNEKIIHKPHLLDDAELIIQLGVDFRTVGIADGKAALTELAQVGGAVGLALRQAETGQVVVAEFEIVMAAVGDEVCIVRGLGKTREKTAHLRFALQVEFLGLEAHAVGLVDGFSGLDAHEHVLIIGIGLLKIMGVVGHDERDAGLPAEGDETLGDALFLGDAVVLDLKKEVLAEELPQLQSAVSGPGGIPV